MRGLTPAQLFYGVVTVEILSMVLFLVSEEDKVRFGGVEGWGYLHLIETKRLEGVGGNFVRVCM